MTAKVLSAVALAVVLLAPSVLGDCYTCLNQTGVPTFCLADLCGKYYYVQQMTGIDEDTTCLLSEFVCITDTTAELITYTIVNNELSSEDKSLLTEISPGVLTREFIGKGIVRTEYILSITQNFDGSYKMLFILCKEGTEEPVRYALVSNIKGVDFTAEQTLLSQYYGTPKFFIVPNTCKASDYVTY